MQVDKPNSKTVTRKLAVPARKAAVPPPRKTASPRARRPAANAAAEAVAGAKAAAQAAPDAAGKERKIKLVRDSISIPKNEYLVLAELKLRAGRLAVPVKKTELIRAGIKALAAMPNTAFLAAVRAVPNLKTGRPAKADEEQTL